MFYISSIFASNVGITNINTKRETIIPYSQLDTLVQTNIIIGYNWYGLGQHIAVTELVAVLCCLDAGVPIMVQLTPCGVPKQCIYLGRKSDLFCFFDRAYFEIPLGVLLEKDSSIRYSMKNNVERVIELFRLIHSRG